MSHTAPEVVADPVPEAPVPVVVAGWVVDPDPDDAAVVIPGQLRSMTLEDEVLQAEAQTDEAYDWTSCTLSSGQASTVQSWIP